MQFWIRGMQNSGGPTFFLLQGFLTRQHSNELQSFVGDCLITFVQPICFSIQSNQNSVKKAINPI